MGTRDLSEEQILEKHNALDSAAQIRAKVLARALRGPACPRPDAHNVAIEIAAEHGVTVAELMGPDRHKTIAAARKALYAALRATGMSYPEIGRFVGGRDHTTVLYGVQSFEAMVRRQEGSEK